MSNILVGLGRLFTWSPAKFEKKSLKIPALIFGSKLRFSFSLRQILVTDFLETKPKEFIIFHNSFGFPNIFF